MPPEAVVRLLLDQGLPRDAATQSRRQGFDCVHVSELGMAAAEDRDILEYARREHRIVVTLDADFHAILAVTRATSPSVIRIRIEGLDATSLAALLEQTIEQYSEALSSGCMLTVKRRRTTCRFLR